MEKKKASEQAKPQAFYTAKGGETLAEVAGKYGTTVAKLAQSNRLDANAKLSGGQQVAL